MNYIAIMLLPILFFTIEPPKAISLNSFDLRSNTLKQSEIDQSANQVLNSGSYSNAVRPVASLNDPDADAKPTTDKPTLTWPKVLGAVYYEIEFTSAPPEQPNNIELSSHRVYSSRAVFTNGYNADLSQYQANVIYWRVRALDLDGNPLGVFSDANRILIDHTIHSLLKPIPTVQFNKNESPTPLYPVYSWIPITGTSKYEVEITSQSPENPNDIQPSKYRIESKEAVGFDCYDDEARCIPGTYYWRVRGLDDQNNAVGVYSDAQPFVVNPSKYSYAAALGDSITHGGGAISYSPSDWEYDFQTYLKFPVVNLGKSGDTSETMAARFDKDVLPYKPKFLIILGGTNSLRHGVPANNVIDELTIIKNKCLANGIRPIFLTLLPINPSAIEKAFNQETVQDWQSEFEKVNNFICKQEYYIDIEPHFFDNNRTLPNYYAIDGLHPDIEGKKLMAKIINENWESVTR